jgi:predicted phosphohydrolase
MRIVCLSDTHLCKGLAVPDGDVLIHAGDLTMSGEERAIAAAATWLGNLPHRHKIVIAGNHDWLFQRQPGLALAYMEPDLIYLEDSGCEIEGLKFWGSPWQPWFQSWACNLPRKGEKLREKWNCIPVDTDELITHGPPYGILDQVDGGDHLGCEELAIRWVAVRPRLHVFGHIHDGYGSLKRAGTLFVNASILDESYKIAHRPVVIDLNGDEIQVVNRAIKQVRPKIRKRDQE